MTDPELEAAMERALRLAEKGPVADPNPRVGCVLLAQARACADPGATTALLEQGNAIMRAHGIEKADLDNDAVTAEKEKILADRVRCHGTVFPPRIFPG